MSTDQSKLIEDLAEILRADQDRPFGCKCTSMRVKLVGDGCSECNPEYYEEVCREAEDHGE